MKSKKIKLTRQQKMLLPRYLRWKCFGWYVAFMVIFDLFLTLVIGSAQDMAVKKLVTEQYATIYSLVCFILIVLTFIYPIIWRKKKKKYIQENFS